MKTAFETAEIVLKKLKNLLIVESVLEVAFMVLCIVPQWAVIQKDYGSNGGLRETMLTFHDVGSGFSSQGAAVDLIVVGGIMLFFMWNVVWVQEDMDKKKCYYLLPMAIQIFIMTFVLVKYVPVEMNMNQGHLLPLAYFHIALFLLTIIVGILIPFFIKKSKRSIKEARERETADLNPVADPN